MLTEYDFCAVISVFSALVDLQVHEELVVLCRPIVPVAPLTDRFDQLFVAKKVVANHPRVQFDFVEGSTRLQLSFLIALGPAFRELDAACSLDMAEAVGGFYHDSGPLALAHMLKRSPKAIRHFRIAQRHLKRLLLVNEDFTFLDLIVAIYLAIRANAGSSSALWKMAIMLECLPLAHLAVLANDIDLDAANVLIENRLLLSLFSFLLFLGRCTVRRSFALLFLRRSSFGFPLSTSICSLFSIFVSGSLVLWLLLIDFVGVLIA